MKVNTRKRVPNKTLLKKLYCIQNKNIPARFFTQNGNIYLYFLHCCHLEINENGNPRQGFIIVESTPWDQKKKKLLKGIDSYLCVHSEVDKEGSSNSYVPASRLLKGFNMKLGHALFFTANIFEIIFFSHTINRIN